MNIEVFIKVVINGDNPNWLIAARLIFHCFSRAPKAMLHPHAREWLGGGTGGSDWGHICWIIQV